MCREATVKRKTKETSVKITLNLDGQGEGSSNTGIPFFDHMLDQTRIHGCLDMTVTAEGDLAIDDHHTVEDVGIVLGQALSEALGNRKGIRRYGQSLVPMDEALAQIAIDLGGRANISFDYEFPQEKTGQFDLALVPEFCRALSQSGRLTLHVQILSGSNGHHVAEALFKGLGVALRMAVEPDPRRQGIPSSKGIV